MLSQLSVKRHPIPVVVGVVLIINLRNCIHLQNMTEESASEHESSVCYRPGIRPMREQARQT